MHLLSASPSGGTPGWYGDFANCAFKVLVFPHPWGFFFLQSPKYLAKPSTQLDLGPSYMVSGTRDNPSPKVTLSSVYMWKRSSCRPSQS